MWVRSYWTNDVIRLGVWDEPANTLYFVGVRSASGGLHLFSNRHTGPHLRDWFGDPNSYQGAEHWSDDQTGNALDERGVEATTFLRFGKYEQSIVLGVRGTDQSLLRHHRTGIVVPWWAVSALGVLMTLVLGCRWEGLSKSVWTLGAQPV